MRGLFALVFAFASAGFGAADGLGQERGLGLPPLVDAAKGADWDAVRVLLEQGADVDLAAADGTTALHWASYWDDVAGAELLIHEGADPGATNDLGATPLWNASLNGSSAMVRSLLEAGADPNAALILGETVVMTAARSGNASAVGQLLASGADPNVSAARGQTALMWAAAQGHSDVVEALLSYDANVHARSEAWTELHKTDLAQAGHGDYQIWIQQGGNTPLMFAVRAGDLASARMLVAAGADVNVEAAYGIAATALAAHSNHADVVEFLLENGADPNASNGGYSALHAAILRGNERAVRTLLAHGADANSPLLAPSPTRRQSLDFFFHPAFVGATPFWLAARFVQPGIMRALAEFGADPLFLHEPEYWAGGGPAFAWREEGATTALMAAVGMGGGRVAGFATPGRLEREALSLEAVRIAVDLGVDITARNRNGKTAVQAAEGRGYDSVVEFLVERGATLD
jgi:ankyrin repeat protein